MHNRVISYRTKRGLKKGIGLLGLVSIGSGAMISSGLFVLPSLVFLKAGPATILAYLLAGVSLIPAVFSKAELVTAMPKSGGVYYFINRSLGPAFSTFGGIAVWFELSLKTAFALFGMGIFIILFNPGFTDMQIKLVAVSCCVVFTMINLIGVKLTARVQNIMVILLLGLLIYYIASGFTNIQTARYTPFFDKGVFSLLSATGMVYISFGGLTKVCAVAGEARNPKRNLPLALIITLLVMTTVYVLVIIVTVGLVDSAPLANTLIPISLAAETYLGRTGSLLMGFTALLAFVTTANAGILTASRDPMAMGRDRLLPRAFQRVNKRGIPRFSVLFTSAFIIAAIMLLDLENLVKTASALKLVLFLLANLSVIAMREGKMEDYNPSFKSPLYPWMQIAGIAVSIIFISMMGAFPLMMVGTFLAFSIVWYLTYARRRKKRVYALQCIIERIKGRRDITECLDDEAMESDAEEDGGNTS